MWCKTFRIDENLPNAPLYLILRRRGGEAVLIAEVGW